jgi:hypothetical protein
VSLSDWDNVSVSLTWRSPRSDGGRPVTHYLIEQKGKYDIDFTQVFATEGTATFFHSGLKSIFLIVLGDRQRRDKKNFSYKADRRLFNCIVLKGRVTCVGTELHTFIIDNNIWLEIDINDFEKLPMITEIRKRLTKKQNDVTTEWIGMYKLTKKQNDVDSEWHGSAS